MNKLQADNLAEIVELKYPNICLNYHDIIPFTKLPSQKRQFYPITCKMARCEGKLGFFNNGQTIVWTDYATHPGYIKIANQVLVEKHPNFLFLVKTTGWSEPMSFQEEGNPLRIYKLMKLKAFW